MAPSVSEFPWCIKHQTNHDCINAGPPDQAEYPITSCHQVPAMVVGGSEGTNHYECPVCRQWVDFEGNRLPDQAAQELRKKIASTWLTREDGLRFKVELPPDQVDALLALMYRERIDELERTTLEFDHEAMGEISKRIKELKAAAQRYGQEGGDRD